ncbi:MAG TPA: potassium channel family protein, partial [Candidatus Paceibacterota bacterium]|nr:potassium channel family protein [Candidatus Paceibacterota bacterium]
CGRPSYKSSKYCIFHAKLAEKEEEEFKKALKEYIEKIKENNLDYNFSKFIFIGKIDFEKEFKLNIFKYVNFMDATFEDEVNFMDATFESSADFERVTFKSNVNFVDTTFKSHAFFDGTIFKKYVDFGGTTFEGIAGFGDVTFDDDAVFEDAIFKGDTYFGEAIFKKNVHFSWAKLPPGKLLSLTVKGRGNIFFKQTFLEHIILSLDLEKDTFIDFTNATLKNTRIKMEEIDGHILQEQEKTFSEAKEIYLLLKNNFHSVGKYKDESWAFKKEKDMERKDNCHFKSLHKWLWSCVLNGVFGYGEQPIKVIISAMSIILIFTFLFMGSGISNIDIERITTKNFFDCIYFSTVTFTTLGLGDFRPVEGWGRILVGTEAFIGAFMMALFVYTFARRTGGR